jgi:hypothetical protein
MSWATVRREPYTEAGVRRLKCLRCGVRPARFQWQICSDGSKYRPICGPCDVELNEMVLQWFAHPDAAALIEAYRREKAEA